MILIADSIQSDRAVFSRLFQDAYCVLKMDSGRRALALLEEQSDKIAAVLLDIDLADMDSFALLHTMLLRGWLKRIPVILIAPGYSDDMALRAYNMGVSDIISRPFHPEVVCRRVQNIVELYNHRFHLENLVCRQTRMLKEQASKLRKTHTHIIDALSSAVEFRNGESGQHIRRVRGITDLLLRQLVQIRTDYKLTEEQIETIVYASSMHDIGKIAIPDSVLLKPGKLTTEEFSVMQAHTVYGCELLQSLLLEQDDPLFSFCYEICRSHHERWDGRGYPDGLEGDEIPLPAQVVSLADVYDALVSERVYKPPYAHRQAVAMILNGECGIFNPQLLQCFIRVEPQLKTRLSARSLWI